LEAELRVLERRWCQHHRDAPDFHRILDACRYVYPRAALYVDDEEASTETSAEPQREGISVGSNPQQPELFRDPCMARRNQAGTQSQRVNHGSSRTAPLQHFDFSTDTILSGEQRHELREVDLLHLEPEDARGLVSPCCKKVVGSSKQYRNSDTGGQQPTVPAEHCP
jgi:hypothetical protein